MNNDNLELYFSRLITTVNHDILKNTKDENLQELNKRAIIYFLISISMVFAYDPIFTIFGMGDPLKAGEEVQTLGISASIMILYNMVGWPLLLEMTNTKVSFENLGNDNDRAWEIVAQVDAVCDFATGIMNMVKKEPETVDDDDGDNEGKKKGKKKKSDLLKGDAIDMICTILNDSRKIVFQVRLREDIESESYGNDDICHYLPVYDSQFAKKE